MSNQPLSGELLAAQVSPIAECGYEERLQRALLACEALSYMYDEGGITAEKFSTDVYCISHVALCTCGNPHENWLKKIEEVEAAATQFNLYDVKKELIGVKKGV